MATHYPRKPGRNGWPCVLVTLAIAIAILIVIFNFVCGLWPAPTHEWQKVFIESVDNNSLSRHLKQLTKDPHVAGTPENFVTAQFVQASFESYGLDAHHKDYDVLLSYPLHRSLSLTQPQKQNLEFALTESAFPSDPYSNNSKVIPTFHGLSPSGNASGEVVYANYGRQEDFERLALLGVEVSGTIVIAKYGAIYRGDIVDQAAKAGALAVVIFSDPLDYGHNGTEGYYPKSKWLPPSGAQRGSVYQGIGDPLTPGWVSDVDAERLSPDDPAAKLPKIPSLPISAEDALPILQSLGGPIAPADWQGALNLSYKLGRGPGRLNLSYVANQTVTSIRNVFGTIIGSQEPDRYVVIGNHRDAWTFGAVDPNSGTATLLETARVFGKLMQQGWRPKRTIVLCSWDAEEYGMLGSTEWVEQNNDIIQSNVVAYLNVDCAVGGAGFYASSSPQLDDLLMEVSKQVKDPDSTGQSVYDSWVTSSKKSTPVIGRLGGGGSDFAAFLQHVGVPSLDLNFGDEYPVYHSVYDNYNWMVNFCDPMFHRHVAMTNLMGLITMRLASDPILPLKYETYADELQTYALAISTHLKSVNAPQKISISPLLSAISNLREACHRLRLELQAVAVASPQLQQVSSAEHLYRQRGLNDRLLQGERAFLDADGIVGDTWFKHLVYGPVSSNSYDSLSFPGIWNAINIARANNSTGTTSAKEWATVQHEIYRVARVTTRASLVLQGRLT